MNIGQVKARSAFLNKSTIYICSWIILCAGDYRVNFKVLTIISDFYSLDATSTSLNHDNLIYHYQISPMEQSLPHLRTNRLDMYLGK